MIILEYILKSYCAHSIVAAASRNGAYFLCNKLKQIYIKLWVNIVEDNHFYQFIYIYMYEK